MAVLVPDAPPVTLPMDRPAIAGLVTNSKLDAETPEAKVTPLGRVTVSAAPFRFASVNVAGLEASVAPLATETEKVRVSSSLDAVFESASRAVTVTVPPLPVGVPQTSRGSVPGQPFVSVPLASKTSPADRPETA